MRLFIVIPAFNEARTIHEVVKRILSTRYSLPITDYVIVVDDGSSDASASEAKRAGATVLSHSINRGQGAALQTGTQYALEHGADVVVHFDADGQHTTADIARLIRPIIDGEVDVVLGSRFLRAKSKEQRAKLRNNKFYRLLVTRDIPLARRILLLGSLITNYIITRLPLTDVHNGLRALSGYAAQRIQISQDKMAHATEYLHEIKRHELSFVEVPVKVHYIKGGKKSQGLFDGFRILKEIILKRAAKF